ncbi:MAG: hypothetical protein AAEJ43_11595 [Gammaproteobacteria bacterium]
MLQCRCDSTIGNRGKDAKHNREVLRDILGKSANEIEAFENDGLLHSGEV